MVLNEVPPKPMTEPDNSTVHTARTPPETVLDDFFDTADPLSDPVPITSSVPWPGSTFIIRAASSGQVLTVLDGRVSLAPIGGPGSIHWACVETKGWLGFRNVVSGRMLGHDGQKGRLRCSEEKHREWENFAVRLRPQGGYLLQMTHFERLWVVGRKVDQGGREVLAKMEGGKEGEIVWEFVKV
ncbi:hypothetical protein H2200_012197 [Cladophialophora chaetospira]|uniref:Uncharacterized protein n=1 Tax=Cladophialophora chaetospira TaxID=386627 RepID=A0AA38WYD8_9EURO|nr:hypothetical protein H2200_012197 [Cladophialophora chaetospira]